MPNSSQRLGRLVRILLLLAVWGSLYRGYWIYSLEGRTGGIGPYLDFVHGIGPAPFQYRNTPVLFANFFYAHFHLPFRYGFELLDLLTLPLAVMLGYELLRRTVVYRQASALAQCLGSVSYLALVVYMLAWGEWYKKDETDLAAVLAILLLLAWSPRALGSWWRTPAGLAATGVGIVAAIVALSTARADVALCLSLGMAAIAFQRRRGDLSLPRAAATVVAAASVVAAAATQLVMMKVVYPHARPYSNVFMLPYDIWRPSDLSEFLVYVAPALWALWQVRKLRFAGDAAGVGFLLGAVPFLLLWMTIGRIEEVRIFMPVALAVTPLVVQMAMLMTERPEGSSKVAPSI